MWTFRVGPVAAISSAEVPNFPSCLSPQGNLKVSYDSGIHGIVGQSGEFSGTDQVYTVSDTTLIQCFCASSGAGIQTDWWKMNSLSQDQIDQLVKLDWVYIPDGSAWGLESTAYLAKNSNYNCLPATTSGGGGVGGGSTPVCDSAKPGTPNLLSVVRTGSTASLTWTASTQATHYTIAYGPVSGAYIYGVPNTGNATTFAVGALDPATRYNFVVRAVNNCMPGDWSTTPAVGGGQVLGLATTGNAALITALLGIGLVTLFLALLSHRRSHRA